MGGRKIVTVRKVLEFGPNKLSERKRNEEEKKKNRKNRTQVNEKLKLIRNRKHGGGKILNQPRTAEMENVLENKIYFISTISLHCE